MWLVAGMIFVSAFAYRSASFIHRTIRSGGSARLAITFSGKPAAAFLTSYVIAGLPLAFVNGYLLRLSWMDCLLVGVGTWLGMLTAIFFSRRFNPVLQFYVFGGASVVWLIVDLVRAVSKAG